MNVKNLGLFLDCLRRTEQTLQIESLPTVKEEFNKFTGAAKAAAESIGLIPQLVNEVETEYRSGKLVDKIKSEYPNLTDDTAALVAKKMYDYGSRQLQKCTAVLESRALNVQMAERASFGKLKGVEAAINKIKEHIVRETNKLERFERALQEGKVTIEQNGECTFPGEKAEEEINSPPPIIPPGGETPDVIESSPA